jgi:hypothetical protein
MFGASKKPRNIETIPSLVDLGLQDGIGLDNNEIFERRKAIFLHHTLTAGSFVSKAEQIGAIVQKNEARHSLRVAAELYAAVTDGMPRHRILNAIDLAVLKPRIPDNFHIFVTSTAHFWVLIDAVADLVTLDDLVNEPTKAKHVQVLQQLRARPEMMKTLGQIITMDLFYGNTDRIALVQEQHVWTWKMFNEGNIFFQAPAEGRRARVVPLDFYDGSCFFRTLNRTIEQVRSSSVAITPASS